MRSGRRWCVPGELASRHMAESYWLAEPAELLAHARRVTGFRNVVVIGGGVTGCSCALTLAEAGLRVRLFEARRVAWGASGRNGGFALRGLASCYPEARERFGSARAGGLLGASPSAVWSEWRGLAVQMPLRRVGSFRLADDDELDVLRAEYEALRERTESLPNGSTVSPRHRWM